MLMGPDNCGVDHGVFVIGILGQTVENLLPDTAFSPAPVAAMNVFPVAKPFRQIPPWNARPIPVKNRFNKQPVILCRCAHCIFSAR